MIIKSRFDYEAPQTVAHAFELFQTHKRAALLAGGSDYVPLLKYGLKNPTRIIGLDQIDYLGRIEKREQGLFIGAMNRLRGLAENSRVRTHCPALADAARLVASPQIRNVGTIGGNICQDRRCIYFNQSRFWRQSIAPCFKTGGYICHQKPRSQTCRAIYYADLAPVLMAVGARVECYGTQGFYEVPMAAFIHDHVSRNGGIQTGSCLVSGFIIPHLPRKAWMRFVKHSVRSSIDFSSVNAAVYCLPPDGEQTPPKVSVVVGAVAPEVIELVETRKLIEAQAAGGDAQKSRWFDAAVAEVSQKSELIPDSGLSPSARRKAFGVVGLLMEQLHDFFVSQRTTPT